MTIKYRAHPIQPCNSMYRSCNPKNMQKQYRYQPQQSYIFRLARKQPSSYPSAPPFPRSTPEQQELQRLREREEKLLQEALPLRNRARQLQEQRKRADRVLELLDREEQRVRAITDRVCQEQDAIERDVERIMPKLLKRQQEQSRKIYWGIQMKLKSESEPENDIKIEK
ncbi:hypothetical protein BX616_008016 [Lobosporangium transversale]|uniref:Uncharacterized protein n=1 Tax=Lobosporangium transversale TaxID=64571 RepID=A0A1Y2GBF9_9FUNG|nr:hypothetical protein BCR41DRAFT_362063 [Lobosporangium transversale]KAF9914571.1 hypothetical protein BX616_008016 [Lobosporangium transversale]ORZ05178.1 hypothetical protein BCR41DRAFT_362063 [Lobosporangium transversale]|eukprot:XP_021876953.1 hypothetical protein BCR41DRAFT_362063 [Lobosporangium transversale]